MRRRIYGSCVAILFLLTAGCFNDDSSGSPGPANVILISIDTLRADHLGCYGYERQTSPNIDALAEEGVLFEQSVNTGGATLSVHMSMMTSLYPRAHGITTSGRPTDYVNRLEDERVTLAEQLHEAGYRSAAFTGAGWVSGRFGFDQGFDQFDDRGRGLREIQPDISRWLQENRNQPFFLFIHTYEVHSSGKAGLPYQAPEDFSRRFSRDYAGDFTGCSNERCSSEWLGWQSRRIRSGEIDIDEAISTEDLEYIIALYDGGIAYVDHELGLLFDRLKNLGIYDNSLIVVTSDHGEEFLEHGQFLHQRNYEEAARVPLIVKFPDSAGYRNMRIRNLTATVDIMPTILDALAIPVNDEAQGVSLIRWIATDRSDERSVHMFSYLDTEKYKLRTDEWSLLYDPHSDEATELYRLSTDSGERHNVIDDYPQVRRDLLETMRAALSADILRRERDQANATDGSPTVELDPETLEQLKALGYLAPDASAP